MQKSRIPTYLIGAAVVGIALAVAGVPLVALVPFAVLLACPLMMFFMMKGMGGMGGMGGGDEKKDRTEPGSERESDRDLQPPSRRS